MKKALRKDFFREIRRNLGRFISIFFIIALGAAFYTGVRSAKYDMKYSADTYYDDSNLMDIRVVSALGLTDDDLEAMRRVEGVASATGGRTAEVLCQTEDTELAVSVIALTEGVNEPTLKEGRLPENAQECLADTAFLESTGYKVGDTVTFQSGTDDPLTDTLAYDTYTITGSAKLPDYMDLSRGTGTIGDGTIDAFVLLSPEAFETEVYTEAYIQVEGAKELFSYSDAYTDRVKQVEDGLDAIADGEAQRRYEELRTDGEQELADARLEIADGEQELADARQELAEGENEIAEAEQTLAEKEQELADGKRQLADGEAQLADARRQLEDGEAQLADGKRQLEEGEAQLDAAQAELDASAGELNEQEARLQNAQAAYDAGLQQYQAAADQAAAQRQQLEAAEQSLAEMQKQLALLQEQEGTLPELSAQLETLKGQQSEAQTGLDALNGQLAPVEEALAKLRAEKEALDGQIAAMEEALAQEGDDGADNEAYQELLRQRAELEERISGAEAGAEPLREQKAGLEESLAELSGGISALEQGIAGIQDAAAAKPQLEEGIARLQEAVSQKPQLEAAEKKLAETKQELDASKANLDQAWSAALPQLEAGRAQLAAGQSEIDANRAQLAQSREELDAQSGVLEQSREELADAQAELESSRAELAEGEQAIEEAKAELAEAKQELADGQSEYDEKAADAEQELADARQQVDDGERALAELEVPEWYILNRETISSYVSFGMDADRMGNIGEVFPVIFFLVAALVSLTAMTRMIEEQRTAIGTLKALGYSDGVIAWKYFSYAMLATVGGSLLGVAVGSVSLPWIILSAYGMMYTGLPEYLTPLNLDQAFLAVLASVASTGVATLAASYRELRAKPAQLMRPESPKSGKRVLLERVRFLWKRMSFTQKSTVRNLVRYKKRFFMTVIGIGGCMALMLVGYGLQDSIKVVAENQYQEIFTYDAAVTLNTKASEEEKDRLLELLDGRGGMEDYTRVYTKSLTLEHEDREWDVTLEVPEEINAVKDFVVLKDRKSRELYEFPKDGVVLTEKAAKELGVSAGDTVTVRFDDDRSAEAPVAVITENYVLHYLYMTPELYEQLSGETPEYNQLWLNYELDSGEQQELGNLLMEQEACSGVSFINEQVDDIDYMLDTLNDVIYVLIISAGMLAFVVLYNLNSINITERKRELATLKVLGFYDSEVGAYVYRENIILTLIGIFAGVFMGIFLHQFIIQTVEVDMMMFGRLIRPVSFLICGALSLLFSLLVNVMMYYRLKKIDMIESLKSVE